MSIAIKSKHKWPCTSVKLLKQSKYGFIKVDSTRYVKFQLNIPESYLGDGHFSHNRSEFLPVLSVVDYTMNESVVATWTLDSIMMEEMQRLYNDRVKGQTPDRLCEFDLIIYDQWVAFSMELKQYVYTYVEKWIEGSTMGDRLNLISDITYDCLFSDHKFKLISNGTNMMVMMVTDGCKLAPVETDDVDLTDGCRAFLDRYNESVSMFR